MKRFKVFKKLCSLALILSMLVSMIPTSVFAAPTIDGSRTTGSLTINKYEKNQQSGLKPISEIPFTIYKIFDIKFNTTTKQLDYDINSKFDDFFNGIYDPSISYGIEAIKDMNGSELEALATNLEGYIKSKDIKPSDEEETNNSGVAEFTGLELGYYFVVEGESEKVDTPIESFFVSIPMTEKDSEGNTYWQYNVVAKPKNIPTMTGVTLKKYKDSIGDSNKFAGVTFVLEKNIGTELEPEWEPVGEELTTNPEGSITVDYLGVGTYRFRETGLPQGEDKYILDTYEFLIQYNETGTELEYVYGDDTYTKSQGLTIIAINEKPTIGKTADKETTNVGDKVGNEVQWTITVTVPSIITELETFTVTDTLSPGLTYKGELTVNQDGNSTPLVPGTDSDSDYVLHVNGQEIKVVFNPTKLEPSKDLVITYKTILNKDAVIGTDGNANSAILSYSSSTETGSEPKHTEPVSDKVYTGGVNIFKHDSSNNPLQGAEFQIFANKNDALNQNNPIEVISGGKLTTTVVSGSDGYASFNGLAYGIGQSGNLSAKSYWIVETKAPTYIVGEGNEAKEVSYNLLKEPVEVTVNPTSHEQSNAIFVLNNKGFTLPETGGMGTVIFTVGGLSLMALAAGAYMVMKRKEVK